MKKLLTIILLLASLSGFSQAKTISQHSAFTGNMAGVYFIADVSSNQTRKVSYETLTGALMKYTDTANSYAAYRNRLNALDISVGLKASQSALEDSAADIRADIPGYVPNTYYHASDFYGAGTEGDPIRTVNAVPFDSVTSKPVGLATIAIGQNAVTVNYTGVTSSSTIFAVIRTNDATAWIKNVVPGSGSFVINLGANATAEVSIGYLVIK